ncbi:MAG: hypothetical protein ACOYK8_07915 [Alphaproteobacteria bacterium]
MLSKDCSPWRTVYKHIRFLRVSWKLEEIMKASHEKARISNGKESSPSVADSGYQSVKG